MLLAEIRGHKAAIRRHRADMWRACAELGELQKELAKRGISMVTQAKGKEAHGRDDDGTGSGTLARHAVGA